MKYTIQICLKKRGKLLNPLHYVKGTEMIIPSCNIWRMGTTGDEKKSILHTKFEGFF